jgi:hypothetical protein
MPRSRIVECENCGDDIYADDAINSNDYLYCQNCYDDMESNSNDDAWRNNDNSGSINSYGYHPTPKFWDFVDGNTTGIVCKFKSYVKLNLLLVLS